MKLEEIVVTTSSNGRLDPIRQKLFLPYDIEMTSNTGITAMHKAGVEVYYAILPSVTPTIKLKLSRTMFSIILTFDSKAECKLEGFKI